MQSFSCGTYGLGLQGTVSGFGVKTSALPEPTVGSAASQWQDLKPQRLTGLGFEGFQDSPSMPSQVGRALRASAGVIPACFCTLGFGFRAYRGLNINCTRGSGNRSNSEIKNTNTSMAPSTQRPALAATAGAAISSLQNS